MIRTIIDLGAYSASVAGAYGVVTVHAAIGITSQEAFAAGAVSDPASGAEAPARGWLWRGSTVVAQNGIGTPVVYPIRGDIRGMRKIENGELFFAMQVVLQVGTTFTTNLSGLIRVLVKLP